MYSVYGNIKQQGNNSKYYVWSGFIVFIDVYAFLGVKLLYKYNCLSVSNLKETRYITTT